MHPIILATDLVAILILTIAIYFRNHGRADLVLAYIGLNIGVMGTTLVMTQSTMAAGLGLGLFGVLSIIRLRSNELSQYEVSYYFAALVLGLISGLQPEPLWLAPAVAATVVVVMAVVDNVLLKQNHRHQILTLDRVIFNENQLKHHLEQLLDAPVRKLTVQSTDLVRDMMVVDVRYNAVRSLKNPNLNRQGNTATTSVNPENPVNPVSPANPVNPANTELIS